MEMFRQNAKSYINYSSEDFMDTTAQDLVHMTPEETICRCHYRMERGLDHCTPEEKQYRMQQFARVMGRNFPGQACEPYAMTEEAVGMTGSIAVLKRSRYFPSVLVPQCQSQRPGRAAGAAGSDLYVPAQHQYGLVPLF